MSFSPEQLSIFEQNISDAKSRTAQKKKNRHIENSGSRKRPGVQKFKDANHAPDQGLETMPNMSQKAPRQAYDADQDGISSLDVAVRGRFRVHVSLAISGGRGRDPDGAMTSILDSLIHAVKRFVQEHPEAEEWAREHLPFDDNFKFIPIQTNCVTMVPEHIAGATVFIEHVTESEIVEWKRKLEF